MKIGILLTRPSPQFIAAAALLRERGIEVDLIYANRGTLDLAQVEPTHDLYVIKSGRGIALALAGVLHARGARTYWPYPTVLAHKDKLVVAAALSAAGLPVPSTVMAGTYAELEAFVEAGPTMLKPHLGSRGEGIQLVRDKAALADLVSPTDGEPLMAQRYLTPDPSGSYLVAYRIGDALFGLQRAWPADDPRDPGSLFFLSDELSDLARRCGDVFDVDLYSVDFVISGDTPYVVDMSLHAGFAGVPDAAKLLADHLEKLV